MRSRAKHNTNPPSPERLRPPIPSADRSPGTRGRRPGPSRSWQGTSKPSNRAHGATTAALASCSPYSTTADDATLDAAISLAAAARLPELAIDGKPQRPSTIDAWVTRGVGGIRLTSQRIGGAKTTTRRFVRDFLDRLNERGGRGAAAPPPHLHRQHRQAEKLLDKAGI